MNYVILIVFWYFFKYYVEKCVNLHTEKNIDNRKLSI